MGDFKQQFNDIFKNAPEFSNQARQNVKSQIYMNKKRNWLPIFAGITIAAVFIISFIIWKDEIWGNQELRTSTSVESAPEHVDFEDIFVPLSREKDSQFIVKNSMISMSRGNNEYIGNLLVDSNISDLNYRQVVLVETEVLDNDDYRFDIGRVIGLPGDKVAIKDGQLYINGAIVNTFYGKAQILGSTDVNEAFERLRRAQATRLKVKIEKTLSISMDEYTLGEGELFIVSDNWEGDSIRKVVHQSKIEGIILGYGDERDGFNTARSLSDEELSIIKALSEQVIIALQSQDKEMIEQFLPLDKEVSNLVISDSENNRVGDLITPYEIEESNFYYAQIANLRNRNIYIKKLINIGYKLKDTEEIQYLNFILENGEWKLDYFYVS